MLAARIDQQTYAEQVRRLAVETEAAEKSLRAASLDQLDIEAVLAFADKLIRQPQKLWTESSLEQKQKLQRVFFPDGVTVTSEGFGTASRNSFFEMLGQVPTGKAILASPTGFEPVLPPDSVNCRRQISSSQKEPLLAMTLPDRCANMTSAARLPACLFDVCLALRMNPICLSRNFFARLPLLSDRPDAAESLARTSSQLGFRKL